MRGTSVQGSRLAEVTHLALSVSHVEENRDATTSESRFELAEGGLVLPGLKAPRPGVLFARVLLG